MEKDLSILREFVDQLSCDDSSNIEDIQAEIDLMEAQILLIESSWSDHMNVLA